MKNFSLLLLIFLCYPMFSQETNSNEIKKAPRPYLTFRHADVDKLYVGWMDPRAFVSRFYANKNFQLVEAFLSRNPSATAAWDFPGIQALLEARIATEMYFFRLPFMGVGFGGALDIPLLSRKSPATLNVYGVMGQAALFVDFFLPHQIKLRITPLFHESTHLADGYRGDKSDFGIISYEFFAIELYKHYKGLTTYGGLEFTYSSVGERTIKTRLHVGMDYRQKIWQKISFIIGINAGAILDTNPTRHPEIAGWSPTVNFALGFELDRYILAMRVTHQRSFEAATYHTIQTHIGFETTIFF